MTLASRVRDRLLGRPEEASTEALARGLRLGSPAHRCRCARALGLDPRAPREPLLAALADAVPGVRRAAAWSLGRLGGGGALAEILLSSARAERRDEPRLFLAVAAARLGAPPELCWAALEQAAARQVQTCYGPRAVAGLAGAGRAAVASRWRTLLDPLGPESEPGAFRPVEPDLLRARLGEALRRDPEDRELLELLAAQQDPRDLPTLEAALAGAGRRASHLLLGAVGEGDPRALARWQEALRDTDVDPGAGFARRARAARALGRLGLPEAVPALRRALTDEALDHEGRPGAGLGVQLPVRDALLAALGECGDASTAGILASYLGNVHGSAQGGFHLLAMDGLVKIGVVEPVLAALEGPEIAAANALGVLAAMGRRELVEACSDGRPLVRAVRKRALGAA